jgi:Tol biopolymer transport system component
VYAQELRPEHYQLFTIRSDGSGTKQITHLVNVVNSDWSPNGTAIVAEVVSKNGAGITLLSPTGSVIRNLTPKGYQGQPSFSPDGKWIVYERDIAPVTIRPDGSGKTDLTGFTAGTENAFAGSFSPGGEQIVFRIESGDTYSLAVIDRDGGNLRRLTTGTGKTRFIDWGTHP